MMDFLRMQSGAIPAAGIAAVDHLLRMLEGDATDPMPVTAVAAASFVGSVADYVGAGERPTLLDTSDTSDLMDGMIDVRRRLVGSIGRSVVPAPRGGFLSVLGYIRGAMCEEWDIIGEQDVPGGAPEHSGRASTSMLSRRRLSDQPPGSGSRSRFIQ